MQRLSCQKRYAITQVAYIRRNWYTGITGTRRSKTAPGPSDPNRPNILPAIPVKIWAGCFTDPHATDPNSALSTAEHYMILRVGNQTANFDLGNYELKNTLAPSINNRNIYSQEG